MSVVGSYNQTVENFIDEETGEKVKAIIKKYLFEPINQETCDAVMEDVKTTFGEDHPAQVNLDDEKNEIEITVRDVNGRWIKCSSSTLFKTEKVED